MQVCQDHGRGGQPHGRELRSGSAAPGETKEQRGQHEKARQSPTRGAPETAERLATNTPPHRSAGTHNKKATERLLRGHVVLTSDDVSNPAMLLGVNP